MSASFAGLVMLVDDESQNLEVLEQMLMADSHKVLAFPRGDLALKAAEAAPPDLVLLDIRMPEMDGYEVCMRFKENERLSGIPIIFLSALADPEDKVRAFEAGGVDYVTKPLSEVEVLARVRTQLALSRYRLQLEDVVRERSAQLAEAHRRLSVWDKAKSEWLNRLSHEMRTPLQGILCVADLLFDCVDDGTAMESLAELRPGYELSRARMLKLIEDSMLLSEIDVADERFGVESVTLAQVASEVVADQRLLQRDVCLCVSPPAAGDVCVLADRSLLTRALRDLLHVAMCCVRSDETISVEVSLLDDGEVAVTVATNGRRLPSDDLHTFFDVGGQRTLLTGGGDFGLGPALAKRIAELFCGRVSVSNGEQAGIVVQIVLPIFFEDD
ncbi:MAG: hybrid sensor histidine kinase/response regulator [Lentisphaerae bacterium]|jgi:two-component system, sensor histidine kinase and response regulator|nr:hybrid sensor histidine kinase/response regulator [Lentisphaerota bacterium]MBT4817613.1 hybrid sensor histidine kinase/response regulator [Lentisphaerota bacterium]MBT5608484.1 hybrid sensor histidine kinase/response regulator [Lentisphaerota bacterium]MBT7057315.1 hybrid sensor histidine kinase/response regulator [Lentisphaerota bacterium]MBT7848178.1 hybrid sensor histidine kinase/response regulator [Lentisphaerota bacterium]